MKRKVFGIVVSLCMISILVAGGVYAGKNMTFFRWGKQTAGINETASATIVANVNGVGIPKTKFDSYKAGLANASGTFTDKEILDKLIEQEVIMQEIQRLGYSVTEAEVTKFNDERFELLDDDPVAYQIVKDYVDGLGITMEEYKEMSKEVSKTALLANKYKADMMSEFENSNSQIKTYSLRQKEEKFEEYFEKKIEELSKKAKIEIVE